MTTTMNRPAFEKLISENLDWLLKQERTLERDHIEAILRDAADRYYPQKLPVPKILENQDLTYERSLDYLYLDCHGDTNGVKQVQHFLRQFEDHNFVQLISEKYDA